jgi:hypothetical protein
MTIDKSIYEVNMSRKNAIIRALICALGAMLLIVAVAVCGRIVKAEFDESQNTDTYQLVE